MPRMTKASRFIFLSGMCGDILVLIKAHDKVVSSTCAKGGDKPGHVYMEFRLVCE